MLVPQSWFFGVHERGLFCLVVGRWQLDVKVDEAGMMSHNLSSGPSKILFCTDSATEAVADYRKE